jgi:hypothetical protein
VQESYLVPVNQVSCIPFLWVPLLEVQTYQVRITDQLNLLDLSLRLLTLFLKTQREKLKNGRMTLLLILWKKRNLDAVKKQRA